MSIEMVLLIVLIILVLCFGTVLFSALKKKGADNDSGEILKELTLLDNRLNMLENANSTLRQELSSIVQLSVKNMGDILSQGQGERLLQIENRLKTFSLENEQKQVYLYRENGKNEEFYRKNRFTKIGSFASCKI